MVIHPGVQFKPVEGDPLLADGDLRETGSNIGVETVAVHAEIERRIPQPQQAR